MAPNKRGDIIVREGQEDELNLLVRNFVVCYGLKKEMFTVILHSLTDLIDRNKGNHLILNHNGDLQEETPEFNSLAQEDKLQEIPEITS